MNIQISRSTFLLLALLTLFIYPGLHGQSYDAHPERVLTLDRQAYRQLEMMNIPHSPDGLTEDQQLRIYIQRHWLDTLREQGVIFQELPIPSLSIIPEMKEAIRGTDSLWDFYPTYTAYVNLMYQFAQQYPGLCRIEEIATLNSGRKLLAAVLSANVDSTEAEPRFLYTSTMHGDEVVGYVLLLRFIDYLLQEYGSQAKVTALLDGVEIWINPLANPDGTYRLGNHTLAGAIRGNANGVDFNRNFPDAQDGPHPDGLAWQEETQAFMQLAQDQQFNMSCNIHGGAEVCNYPWDTWNHLPADEDWWVEVCNRYADTAQFYSPAGYMNDFGSGVVRGYVWYSINGGRQDYMNYFRHCREFTLEISGQKFPSASTLPSFWNYNYRSLLNYASESLYGLRGLVSDSLTGQALRAMVQISGHDYDSSEVFSRLPLGDYYRYLAPGYYNVTFSAPSYHSRSFPQVQIQPGQASLLNVALLPLSSSREDQASGENASWYFDQDASDLKMMPGAAPEVGAEVSIYDFSGRRVSIHPLVLHTLDLSFLPGGVYVARIRCLSEEQNESSLKFIKKRD